MPGKDLAKHQRIVPGIEDYARKKNAERYWLVVEPPL